MNLQIPHLNLILAWLWVVLGFASGCYLGLNFHREDWLGGYGSFKRRLYRLGHISFFGLAMINLMFYFVAREISPPLPGQPYHAASMSVAVNDGVTRHGIPSPHPSPIGWGRVPEGRVRARFGTNLPPLENLNLSLQVASWGFILGALTMPICCWIMAHHPRFQMLFAIPVLSLMVGGLLTLLEVIKL